jgi:hypothetical protein
MALVATSLDFSVAKELAGESKNASSGMQTLNDRSSIGNETLKTETASFRGIDTGSVEGFWLYFFRSEFFLQFSRNLRCPLLHEWLILCKNKKGRLGKLSLPGYLYNLELSWKFYSTPYGQIYQPKKDIIATHKLQKA